MSEPPRLAARFEVMALIRQAGIEGGFASVVHTGHAEAGTILLLITEKGANARVYERMPSAAGARDWHCAMSQATKSKQEIDDYLSRRAGQDSDLWIVELDIADGERLIGLSSPSA